MPEHFNGLDNTRAGVVISLGALLALVVFLEATPLVITFAATGMLTMANLANKQAEGFHFKDRYLIAFLYVSILLPSFYVVWVNFGLNNPPFSLLKIVGCAMVVLVVTVCAFALWKDTIRLK